jgi:hypothetical protein
MSATAVRFLSGAVFVLAIVLSSVAGWRQPLAQGQEAKRYVYKVVDVPTDNNAMQTTLNEYGAAGWELIAMSMGDLTAPRMVFKK